MRARQKVSRAGVELIKSFEGLRTTAARLPDGRWTLGYGHTFSAREGARVTQEDADALLRFDLLPVVDAINNLVLTPLNQNQFDALVSFCFNIGVENFGQSTVLKRINEGKLAEAALAMDSWRSAEFNGQTYVLAPLIRRRAAEKDMFQTPDEISHQAAVLGRPVEDVTPVAQVPAAPAPTPDASLINPYAAAPQRQVIDLGAGEPAPAAIDMQAAIARAQAELREENLRQEALKQEALKLEAQRQADALAAARAAEDARIREEARLQDLQRLEAAKEAARLEAARLEAARESARLEAARQEAIRQEAIRLEAAKLEQQRLEQWRLEQTRLEAERAEAARLEIIRAEAIRQEQIRQEQVRAEQARLEAERLAAAKEAEREAERAEAERAETARLEAEKAEAARLEAERAEQERLEAEQAERERAEAAREEAREATRREAERLENEHKVREQDAERIRLEQEQQAREAAAKAQPVEDEAEKARKAEAAAALMRLYSPYGGGSLGRPLTPLAAKPVVTPEPQPAAAPVVEPAPAAEFTNHSVISPSPVENAPFELSARNEDVEPEPEVEAAPSVVDFSPIGSASTMPPPVITALNPYAKPIPAVAIAETEVVEAVVEVPRPVPVDLSTESSSLNWREQLQRPLPQDYQAPEVRPAAPAEPEQPFLRAGPSSNFQTAAYEDDNEAWMMNGDRIAVSAEESEEEHETLWQMFVKTLWGITISGTGLGCLGVAAGAWWQATHDQTVIRNGMVDSYTFISIGTAALGILFVSISVWLIMKRLGGLKD